MTASKIVLITGATGFLGAQVVSLAIAAGYTVRATARSPSKATFLKSLHPAVQTALVTDQFSANNFTEALTDVSFIIHLASPFQILGVTDGQKQLIDPALKLVTAILEAAANSPTVKRVVTCSSFAAVVNPEAGGIFRDHEYSEADFNPSTAKAAVASGEVAWIYETSKALAEKAAWAFMAAQPRHFDLTVLCPPMIYGSIEQPVESPQELNTSSLVIYQFILPQMRPIMANPLPFFVNVADIAKVHVQALTNEKCGGERYIVCGGACEYSDILTSIKENFPHLEPRLAGISEEILKSRAHGKINSEKVRRDFPEVLFKEIRETVSEDVVPQLLKLEGEWAAAGKIPSA